MPLDDDTREFLRKILKDENDVKLLFGRFRQKSKTKLYVVETIESRAKENPALHELATYIKHMQRDQLVMEDMLEASILNSIDFRMKIKSILKDSLRLHKMADDELGRVQSRIEQVDKDVKGLKEHEDILTWIDHYIKSQTNGDVEDGR